MDRLKFAGLCLLSLSLLCLAFSIVYFTKEIGEIREQIPDILQQVETTSEQIAPTVSEVPQIPQLIIPIIEEVSKIQDTIPAALEEVRGTRDLVPDVLEEVDLSRKELSKSISTVVEQVSATRKELPTMLAAADKASEAVRSISGEVGKVRPMIPGILEESKKIREIAILWNVLNNWQSMISGGA